MLFAIHCIDKPDSQAVRAANRAAHLEHVADHQDRILTAGPLLSDDGAQMMGSLLVLDFADRAEVEKFIKDDPYNKAGLFIRVDVKVYRAVFPKSGS